MSNKVLAKKKKSLNIYMQMFSVFFKKKSFIIVF